MTPKEKAIELKHKMYAKILDYNLDYRDSNNIIELNIFDDKAKQCALIAVDELIEATSVKYEYNSDFELKITGKKPLQYWLDVKQEITKL
jgi:oligoribonuclease NrnB/cAMP/cGMP phosphodiesterase (DHH superfamily)